MKTTDVRSNRAAAALALTALIGWGGVVGCSATGSSPAGEPMDPLEAAEAATRDGLWATAAHRWHEIYLAQGGREVRPCAETARALLHLDDAKGAQALCQQGLALHPGNAELLEYEAHSLWKLGYRRAAEARLEEALVSSPDRVTSLVALGSLRIDLGLEKSAIPPLERALELNDGDAGVWTLLGRAALAAGDCLKAYQVFRTAFELRDPDTATLVSAARLWADPVVRNRYPDAPDVCMGWLDRAIERDPQNLHAHFQLGALYSHRGENHEAIVAYRRAVELEPTCVEAITNLAKLYARTGDVERTQQMVARALELETAPARRRALQQLMDSVTEPQTDPADEDLSLRSGDR